jgi:hypothetical protein
VSGNSEGIRKENRLPRESELGMFLTDILPPRCEGYPRGKQALWVSEDFYYIRSSELWVSEGFYYIRSSELIAFGC